jgi:hypothetical protein
MVLNHADDVVQLHLAERTPPFAVLVSKSQTPEMFALYQHHLIHRRQDAVLNFSVRGRGRICHTPNIGRPTTIGSPDFAKVSTALGLAVSAPLNGCFRRCQSPANALDFVFIRNGGIQSSIRGL